jgi:predicted nucleic acid-binding protein
MARPDPAQVFPQERHLLSGVLALCYHDSLYLATALLTDSRLITADRRLFDAGRRKAPLRNRVLWVEDIPA